MKLSIASSALFMLVAGTSTSSCSAFQPVTTFLSSSRIANIHTFTPQAKPLSHRKSSTTAATKLFQSASTTTDEKQSTSSTSPPPRPVSLYNSLTRSKDPFTPILPQTVSMYTCGPTVYDYAHVGNFRAFLTYDVLKRALSYFGYNVDHICNLTDVDDKIIARCDRENISLFDLTRKFEGKFRNDLEALNIIPAREYPRATEHIDEMVELIQQLEKNGLAYQSEEGSWYFNVAEKEGYGKQLVDLDVGNMKKGASGIAGAQRKPVAKDADGDTNADADSEESEDEEDDTAMDADEYDADKVGARDFALWKAYKPQFDRDDATWDTPIGRGRPGWHLECSAMARKYLGDSIDIHCGGIDLKFPHHENEIAQSEGATGEKFCHCWLHNGFVNIGDEKMSKSKGNFLTLRTACPTADDVRAYRYLVVSSQYRNPLSFTDAAMGAAKGALKRMDNVMRQLDGTLKDVDLESLEKEDNDSGESTSTIVAVVKKELDNFETALADDLSMPRASASLFGVIKAAEAEFKRHKKEVKDAKTNPDMVVTPMDLKGLTSVKAAIEKMDTVFGVFYDVPKEKNDDGTEVEEEVVDETVPDDIMKLVAERTAAKDAKDWDTADSLRKKIMELGFAVKDVKGGDPIVSRI